MPDPRVAADSLARWCASQIDSAVLSEGLFDRLASAIPYEGIFLASVDPASLLYTRASRRGMPAEASTAFVAAEFGADDVNQLRTLVRSPTAVGWLDAATHGDRGGSSRYRGAMRPFGLGDELRAALLSGGTCWGLLCLHRADGATGFNESEAELLSLISPHVAEAMRRAFLMERARGAVDVENPGLVLLHPDGTARTLTAAGRYWLDKLGETDRPSGSGLPTVVAAVVERLRHGGVVDAARARTLTPSGQWVTVHASALDDADGTVAVIMEPTSPVELAPVLLAAYGITRREGDVVRGLLVGQSRKAIAADLHLSLFTVHDHVKAIFDKTGVSSAGQLRMQLFRQQLPT
jgi:DNA-binding CsgD family transcriptional regulator